MIFASCSINLQEGGGVLDVLGAHFQRGLNSRGQIVDLEEGPWSLDVFVADGVRIAHDLGI